MSKETELLFWEEWTGLYNPSPCLPVLPEDLTNDLRRWMSVRAYKALYRLSAERQDGAYRISPDKLRTITAAELLSLRGVGDSTVYEIQKALKKAYGLTIR